MSSYTSHDERIRIRLIQTNTSVERIYIFAARFANGVALNEAERLGREFSPIYWYLTDDNEIMMTLWDMT